MAWPTTAKRLCPWKNWIQLIVFSRILANKCMITSYVIGFLKNPLQAEFSHWLSILFFSAKEITQLLCPGKNIINILWLWLTQMHSAAGLVCPSLGEVPGFGMLQASILLQRRGLRLPRWEGTSWALQLKLGGKKLWFSSEKMKSEPGKGGHSSQQVFPIPPSLPDSHTSTVFSPVFSTITRDVLPSCSPPHQILDHSSISL